MKYLWMILLFNIIQLNLNGKYLPFYYLLLVCYIAKNLHSYRQFFYVNFISRSGPTDCNSDPIRLHSGRDCLPEERGGAGPDGRRACSHNPRAAGSLSPSTSSEIVIENYILGWVSWLSCNCLFTIYERKIGINTSIVIERNNATFFWTDQEFDNYNISLHIFFTICVLHIV